jgi:hypothetical protein
MTSTLAQLQERFAERLVAGDDAADAGLAVYRTTIRSNYRNALGATYPVVCALLGAAAFDALTDAYVTARPSACGDLNVYGDGLGDVLTAWIRPADPRLVADVARLEWAIDEAARAADVDAPPADVFAAMAAIPVDALPSCRFPLQPCVRLVHVHGPVLQTWQTRVAPIEHARTSEWLMVRRDAVGVGIERLAPAGHAWLAALAEGARLGEALGRALALDPALDVSSAVGARIADGTLARPRNG